MKYHSLVVGKRIFDHEIAYIFPSNKTGVCDKMQTLFINKKKILQIRETPFINADMKADIIDGTRRWLRLDLYHNDDVRLMD
ncbi:unnamed protein product [Rhizophagus irregularis]|uniref:Uncharacterized protein n=1 Tax=Rhizophagus irregularis TaxID=588596 RepID=A0A915ZT85_9GLOM|nr:unnamed protein product [Rhizophagus irregularis]CAB5390018.1 unnamed protein product [Rhizophagus irregularis]